MNSQRLMGTLGVLWLGPAVNAAEPAGQGALVPEDALHGASVGTRSGGVFVQVGWQVTGKSDSICWHVPATAKGREFVCFPMGILAGGVTFEARRPLQFQVFHPLTGAAASSLTLDRGEPLHGGTRAGRLHSQ